MFFDVVKKRDNMGNLLVELAKEWNELWQRGQKQEAAEMKSLKERIGAAGKENGLPPGIYWWERPWEEIFEALRADTALPDGEKGVWEWEYELEAKEKDEVHFLFLKEHGRCYGVAVHEDRWDYQKDSAFSEDEQKELTRNYKNRLRQAEFYTAASLEGAVYSSRTDRMYDSAADYFMSAEHWIVRNDMTDRFEKSLYTDHWTHHLSASSANVHAKRVYGVAGYHVEDGTLDLFRSEEFRLYASEGPSVKPRDSYVSDMDPMVLCAGYLAKDDTVRQVPRELFGKSITKAAATYREAVRQAEIFTCLAKKMR